MPKKLPAEVREERHRRNHLRGMLRRRYGISLEDYEALLEAQNRVCAVCEEPCAIHERLSVDHDHGTGAIRGLLCHRCNMVLAFAQDSKRILARAIQYLEEA